MHGIEKRKNAPEIEWSQMKEDKNVISEAVQYLDSLVTTINSGLNVPLFSQYSC